MPDVYIKTPNLDAIFEKWKISANRKSKKKLDKEFGTKGSVFSLDAISAAEYVKNNMKEAAIYFAIKKTIGAVSGKGKAENIEEAPRLSRITFYSFKQGKVNKEIWSDKDNVPTIESLKGIPCPTCKGKGFTDNKCKPCKGTGKLQTKVTVLTGESRDKEVKIIDFSCADCYGAGTLRVRCKDCGGHKNKFKYEILPVPFKTVVTGIPVLHSSAQTKFEREIEQDLHKLIKEVDGIKFNDFKTLESKAEGSLGYWNKAMKKTIGAARSDYQKYEKDKQSEVITQIYLFPMIQLFCETKRGSKFEIYSLGSQNKFMIYSTF